MNLRPFHNCPLELLPRWLLSLASICLVIEACFQIAARVRLHLVCETVNMTLLGLLVLCGWFFVLFDKPKAARACYLAYAIELFTDAFVMYPHNHGVLQAEVRRGGAGKKERNGGDAWLSQKFQMIR